MLKSLFNKVPGFFKMRLQHRGFLVNIVKSLRVPILKKPASVSPIFFWVTLEVESFSADLLQAGRCNLVCVDD